MSPTEDKVTAKEPAGTRAEGAELLSRAVGPLCTRINVGAVLVTDDMATV